MPVVRAVARDAAKQDYRFSAIVAGIVSSAPFRMKAPQAGAPARGRRRRRIEVDTDVHHSKAPATADVPEGDRRHHGAAAARLDGAGADAPGADGGEAASPGSASSTCRTAPSWTSGRRPPRAPGSSSRPSSSRSRRTANYVNVVSGLGHKAADSTAVHSLSPTTWLSGVRPKATQGVDAFAGITADQIAAQAIGQDSAAAVDGARHRGSLGPHRLVRRRLRLHLHEHAVVAHAHDASADGDQSAQGLRADVRRGRQRGAARGAHPGRPQHPRRDRQGSGRPAAAARPLGSPDDGAVPRERARDRAPHPARREEPGRAGLAAAVAPGRRPVRLRGARRADVRA